MRPVIALSNLLLALAACSSPGPEQVSYSRPTITYRVEDAADRSEAEQRAQRYCDGYGLDAAETARDTDSRGAAVATYECR